MHTRFRISFSSALGLLCMLRTSGAAAADVHCQAQSSPEQKTLVELYTSDGCSSCPPANQWLSSVLASGHSSIIPVSLHVTYWNYLGWQDAYSNQFFDQRQNWYAGRASNNFPYTPELFRNGREWQGWRGRGNTSDRESIAPPAPVTLAMDLRHVTTGSLDVQVTIRQQQAGALPQNANPQLVVFLYEDGVVEHPDAGELRGERLRHDHVVRAWKTVDRPQFQQANALQFVLPPDTDAARSGLVAFLQDRTSGAVFQAIDLPYCR
jgi:hypothetical protein